MYLVGLHIYCKMYTVRTISVKEEDIVTFIRIYLDMHRKQNVSTKSVYLLLFIFCVPPHSFKFGYF